MALHRSSQKTNKQICFVCFFAFHGKQTNSFVCFLGESMTRPNCIWFYLTFKKNGKLIFKIPWPYFICDLRISLAPLLNPCIYDMIHVATEIKIHWKKVSTLLGEFTLESKCFWKWIIYIYKILWWVLKVAFFEPNEI